MTAGDGFLSRWSRRKAGSRSGAAVADAPAAPDADVARRSKPALPAAADTPAPGAASVPARRPPKPPPLPTLDDVAALTHASDFSPFVARGVDAGVRNAAMKKLFSDPHFNVMDGLDTYIDDYGKADPIPLSMLRRMNQSAVLGLFARRGCGGAAGSVDSCPARRGFSRWCRGGGDGTVDAASRSPRRSRTPCR